MTQKIFVLNFITSYMGIFLTAFVYIPFASVLVPYLDVFQLIAQKATRNSKLSIPERKFHINQERLKKQVIYFTVTAQVVNQILEVVVPYIKARTASKIKEVQTQRAIKQGKVQDITASDPPDEAAFLKRVRKEAKLDVYDD